MRSSISIKSLKRPSKLLLIYHKYIPLKVNRWVLRQNVNLFWRCRRFPRFPVACFPVAKRYYRHTDLTSTVRGRWQHIYYDAFFRNFSFAVLCKSNQSVTALWNRMLQASNAMAKSFVRTTSMVRTRGHKGSIWWSLRSIITRSDLQGI